MSLIIDLFSILNPPFLRKTFTDMPAINLVDSYPPNGGMKAKNLISFY
jgi:hypothetical protein